MSCGEDGRGVGSDGRQGAKLVWMDVQTVVHQRGGLIGGESIDMRLSLRAVSGAEEGYSVGGGSGARRQARYADDAPLEGLIGSEEWKHLRRFIPRCCGNDKTANVAENTVDARVSPKLIETNGRRAYGKYS